MSDKPSPGDYDIPPTYTYPTDPITDGRRGVIEARSYKGSAITHLLWNVKPGDVLDVRTWGRTTPDPHLTVAEHDMDEVIAIAEGGSRYRLWPRYHRRGSAPPSPWLRTEPGDKSAGELHEIVVHERVDGDGSHRE